MAISWIFLFALLCFLSVIVLITLAATNHLFPKIYSRIQNNLPWTNVGTINLKKSENTQNQVNVNIVAIHFTSKVEDLSNGTGFCVVGKYQPKIPYHNKVPSWSWSGNLSLPLNNEKKTHIELNIQYILILAPYLQIEILILNIPFKIQLRLIDYHEFLRGDLLIQKSDEWFWLDSDTRLLSSKRPKNCQSVEDVKNVYHRVFDFPEIQYCPIIVTVPEKVKLSTLKNIEILWNTDELVDLSNIQYADYINILEQIEFRRLVSTAEILFH